MGCCGTKRWNSPNRSNLFLFGSHFMSKDPRCFQIWMQRRDISRTTFLWTLSPWRCSRAPVLNLQAGPQYQSGFRTLVESQQTVDQDLNCTLSHRSNVMCWIKTKDRIRLNHDALDHFLGVVASPTCTPRIPIGNIKETMALVAAKHSAKYSMYVNFSQCSGCTRRIAWIYYCMSSCIKESTVYNDIISTVSAHIYIYIYRYIRITYLYMMLYMYSIA